LAAAELGAEGPMSWSGRGGAGVGLCRHGAGGFERRK